MTVAASRYLLRPMTLLDIPRVSEIERESFPTMWPQTAYKRELQRNNLAAYLVVCERPIASTASAVDHDGGRNSAVQEKTESGGEPGGAPERQADRGGLIGRMRRLLHGRTASERTPEPATGEQILGFVGLWFMVDEAHIVTIAVAESQRRRGLGEMLLIAAIELAQRRGQEAMTLECRVSNTAAQALYEKYGFRRVGVRKRYYTDNDEDALIMTTFPIRTLEYQAEFERLRAAHAARWGAPRVAHPEL